VLAPDPVSGDSGGVETAVAVAQSWCAGVAVHHAEECIQLHGGIGMTWEHPAHLFLKRAKAGEIALGTPGDHRDALTSLADLPAPA
jgi:Acyl-CoA dehydrogenases